MTQILVPMHAEHVEPTRGVTDVVIDMSRRSIEGAVVAIYGGREGSHSRESGGMKMSYHLRLALRQSAYIIIDLRRMDGRIPSAKLLSEIERCFNDAKAISISLS